MANTKIQSEQIADSAIVTDRIAADAITTAKIADNVALGGSPTTTTQSGSDNSTKIATTAYVTSAVASLIDSAPSTLNTLNEIAAALNDDANFNTTVTNSIAAKLPLAGGTLTGTTNINAALTVKNGYNETKFIRNADVASVGAAGHYLSIGALNSGSVVTPNVISGVTDSDGTSSSFALMQDGANSLSFNSSKNATFAGTINSGDITVKTSADNAVNQGLRIERSNNSDTGFINYQGGAFRMVATDGDPIRFGHVSDSNEVSIHTDGKLLAGVTSAGARSAHTLARTGAFAAEILQQQTSAGASVLGLTYDGAAPNNTTDYFIYAIDNAGIKYRLHSDGSSIQSGGITAGASTFNGTVNLASGTLSLRGDVALDHDGSSLYIKAPSAIYLYPNNTNRGNISAAGVLTLTSSSGTHTLGSSATNLVADFVSTDGTAAIRLKDNGGNVELSTASGNFQIQPAGGSSVFTTATTGETTIATGLNITGFSNLGGNADGRTDRVRLYGTSLYQSSSGNRYGNYGSIMFNSTANWTSAARRVLITNGLNSYKFGIITGTGNATTDPDISSTSTNGGNIVNGRADVAIDLTNGAIGYGTDSPVYRHHTTASTAGNSTSSPSGYPYKAIQSTSAPAGGYYAKEHWYHFSGNTDHTLVWGNTDSYFSAMVELWAGCSNGGARNNIYVRGFWHTNHTAHHWDELDRTANVSNGDTFTFTAAEYSSGSAASKLTLFHDYGSASFYYGKVKLTIIAGGFTYYNQS